MGVEFVDMAQLADRIIAIWNRMKVSNRIFPRSTILRKNRVLNFRTCNKLFHLSWKKSFQLVKSSPFDSFDSSSLGLRASCWFVSRYYCTPSIPKSFSKKNSKSIMSFQSLMNTTASYCWWSKNWKEDAKCVPMFSNFCVLHEVLDECRGSSGAQSCHNKQMFTQFLVLIQVNGYDQYNIS